MRAIDPTLTNKFGKCFDKFGKCLTKPERVHRDWTEEKEVEEEKAKMGERNGAGQGGEKWGLAQR